MSVSLALLDFLSRTEKVFPDLCRKLRISHLVNSFYAPDPPAERFAL